MKVPMPLPLPLLVPAAYYYCHHHQHQHLLHSSSYFSYNSCPDLPKCIVGTWLRPRVWNPMALSNACKASCEPAGRAACIRASPQQWQPQGVEVCSLLWIGLCTALRGDDEWSVKGKGGCLSLCIPLPGLPAILRINTVCERCLPKSKQNSSPLQFGF